MVNNPKASGHYLFVFGLEIEHEIVQYFYVKLKLGVRVHALSGNLETFAKTLGYFLRVTQ